MAQAIADAVPETFVIPKSPLADIAIPTVQSLGDALSSLPPGTLPPGVQAALDGLRQGIDEAKSAHRAATARVEELKALAQQRVNEAKAQYDRLMAEKRHAESSLAEGREALNDALARYENARAELKQQVEEAKALGKALSQEARNWADRPPPLPRIR